MSEWEFLKVKDLVFDESIEKPLDGNHGNLHPKGEDFLASGIPFIMASDIQNSKIDLKGCKFISENQARSLRKGFAKTGDVLLTHKATLGRTAIVPKLKTDFIILTPQVTYYRIKNKHRIDNSYLKYYFDTPDFQKTIQNHGDAGSTRAYIGITAQYDLPVILPPFKEQQAIASVLSSLDDKIDLLHRQNKTLESMAETLFRQWFIEEAQNIKKELPLKDLVDIIDNRGKTPPYQETKSPYPIIEVNALGQNGRSINYSIVRKYVNEQIYNTWFRKHLNQFDILVSTVGSIGSLAMFFCGTACIAQNVIGLRSKKLISNFYLYQWLLFYADEIKELDIGSVQPSIKVPHLLNLSVKIPSPEKLVEFDNQIQILVKKILKNDDEIALLEKLRDTLLPKLMSGEVRVKYSN